MKTATGSCYVDYSGMPVQGPRAWGGVLLLPGQPTRIIGGRFQIPHERWGKDGELAAQLLADDWLRAHGIQATRCGDEASAAKKAGALFVPKGHNDPWTLIAHRAANLHRRCSGSQLEHGIEQLESEVNGKKQQESIEANSQNEKLPLPMRVMMLCGGDELAFEIFKEQLRFTWEDCWAASPVALAKLMELEQASDAELERQICVSAIRWMLEGPPPRMRGPLMELHGQLLIPAETRAMLEGKLAKLKDTASW